MTALPTAPAEEAVPATELTMSATVPPQGVDLMDKFQKEYAGCAVDPNADPALVQSGKLDQLPVATHDRLGVVVDEVKNLANSLIRKVQVADQSLLVSLLWGG